jgi:hypothetical protein
MKSIILDYAIERKGDIETVYQYDFLESLNIITIDNEKKVFIDSSHKDVCLLTKTKAMTESDDDNINVLELQTKTNVSREQDDEYNFLLKIQTKIFIV